jgi:hypothetical protein
VSDRGNGGRSVAPVRARISKRLDGKESLAVHVLQCLSGIIGCLSRQLFVALQMASLCSTPSVSKYKMF